MYINLTQNNKSLWTHTSLVPPETHNKVASLVNGQGSFQNKVSLVATYLSLEAVNRIAPAKKLALYFKAGIVGAVFLGSRYSSLINLESLLHKFTQKMFNPIFRNYSMEPPFGKINSMSLN